MNIVVVANIVAAVFTVGAAVLWLLSARVETPKTISGYSRQQDEFVENRIVGPVPEHAPGTIVSEDLDRLVHALRRQSRLSASAAGCACVAAVAQAAAVLMPVIAGFLG